MILKIVLGLVGLLVVLVGGVLITGALLPREHVATGEALIAEAPDVVAARIVDPAGYPAWRKGVITDQVRREGERVLWREISQGDKVDYALDVEEPGRRWRTTILTKGMPYGGYWLIELTPEGAGSRVRVSEHGFVDNLAFRALGRFVFGFDSSLKTWLADLASAR